MELAVEQLKPLEQLCEPDERQRSWTLREKDGRFRTATQRDIYSAASGIAIAAGVPEPVRSQLEIARALLAYSWYFYPFTVTACLQAFLATERALRYRAHLEKGTVKSLLARAMSEGWLREEGFSKRTGPSIVMHAGRQRVAESEADAYLPTLAAGLTYLRNRLAHGTYMLFPDGAEVVRVCAELVNQLFAA